MPPPYSIISCWGAPSVPPVWPTTVAYPLLKGEEEVDRIIITIYQLMIMMNKMSRGVALVCFDLLVELDQRMRMEMSGKNKERSRESCFRLRQSPKQKTIIIRYHTTYLISPWLLLIIMSILMPSRINRNSLSYVNTWRKRDGKEII